MSRLCKVANKHWLIFVCVCLMSDKCLTVYEILILLAISMSIYKHKCFIYPSTLSLNCTNTGIPLGTHKSVLMVNINLTNCFWKAQAHSRIGIYSENDPSETKRLFGLQKLNSSPAVWRKPKARSWKAVKWWADLWRNTSMLQEEFFLDVSLQ